MKVGKIVLGIAMGHELVGFVLTWGPLMEIVGAGVVGAVSDDQPWRLAAFWFHLFGLAMAVVGWSWKSIEDAGQSVALGPVVGFLGMCAVGATCMPVSGFWLGGLVLLRFVGRS